MRVDKGGPVFKKGGGGGGGGGGDMALGATHESII